jgi:hypothetical protein
MSEFRITDIPLETTHYGRMSLVTEFCDTHPTAGEHLQNWFEKLLRIQSRLHGTELEIPDPQFVRHIMNSIPDQYCHVTDMIEMQEDFTHTKDRVMSQYLLNEAPYRLKENKQLPRILRIWPEYRLSDIPLEANHFGRTLLFLEFTETAPIKGENLQSWFAKLLHIQRRLQGTETQISDSRFIQHIMVNIPGHYETITDMIRMDDDLFPTKTE